MFLRIMAEWLELMACVGAESDSMLSQFSIFVFWVLSMSSILVLWSWEREIISEENENSNDE